MGTDIHLYVEEIENDEWREVVPPYHTNLRTSWSPFWENRTFDHGKPDPEARDYNLFAFLADVRNGYGFAGSERHKPIAPQFQDRGIPQATSYSEPEYDDDDNLVAGCYLGDHSFTHATLRELLEAPWDMLYESVGVVSVRGFNEWRENGMPESWSGGVHGGGILHLSNDEFAALVDAGLAVEGKHYTRVSWKWRPLENCGFRRWIIDLGKAHDVDRTRVLMGFDS